MAKRAVKKAVTEPPLLGQYALHALGPDAIRVDLYDSCIPAADGEPTAGWGVAFLTHEQAIALARALTTAAVQARPGRAAPTAKKKKVT